MGNLKMNQLNNNGVLYDLEDKVLHENLSNFNGVVINTNGSLKKAEAGTDYDYPVINGVIPPQESQVGQVGQHYLNTAAIWPPFEYVCVKAENGAYDWRPVQIRGIDVFEGDPINPKIGDVWINLSETGNINDANVVSNQAKVAMVSPDAVEGQFAVFDAEGNLKGVTLINLDKEGR